MGIVLIAYRYMERFSFTGYLSTLGRKNNYNIQQIGSDYLGLQLGRIVTVNIYRPFRPKRYVDPCVDINNDSVNLENQSCCAFSRYERSYKRNQFANTKIIALAENDHAAIVTHYTCCCNKKGTHSFANWLRLATNVIIKRGV
jgi:hypothetical protein